MEEYWNPNDPAATEEEIPAEQEPAAEETEPVEEPPKPKKKKSFKRKVRRAIRRFFKLPLLTRIIALAAVVLILAGIIVLAIVLPKSCKGEEKPVEVSTAVPSDAPVETPSSVPSEPTVAPDPTATPFIIPALTANLKVNDSDPNVVPYVRTRLVELGYMEMPENNDALFDQATQNAIKRFQYRNFPDNVKDWDGWIGTKTYELLTSSSAKAMREEAVRSFQKANSIDSDGVAGQATLKLIDALASAPASSDPSAVIENVTPEPANQ